jgi:putative copper resistance protein D
MLLTVSVPVRMWALEEETLGEHDHKSLPEGGGLMDHTTHNGAQAGTVADSMEQEAGIGNTPHSQHDQQHQQHQQHGGNGTDLTNPHHHEAAYTAGSSAAGAHHHHRAPVLPPDEDQAYSELNHQIAGVFVFLAGGFALIAASGNPRFSWAQYSWPLFFFLMGLFLFVRHDPESWPWGPLPLFEAMRDPQVLQHSLFTVIVLGIGVVEWLRCRGTLTHPAWRLIFPVLAVSAASMLFLHKHGDGPTADKIYLHHVTMAIAGILSMVAKVLADAKLLPAKVGSYTWSALMMFIGVMLLLYTE